MASAYLSNPALLARQAALRATDETVPQVLAQWRPSITVSGSGGHGEYFSSTKNPHTIDREPVGESMTVSQSLYQGGRTVAAARQARNQVKAGQEQLRSLEQSVLFAAAQAYLDVVRDEQILKRNIANVGLLQTQFDAVAARLQHKEATAADLNQADARLAGAIFSREQAESQLQNSRAVYSHVVGHDAEGVDLPERPAAMELALDVLLGRSADGNPDIAAAKFSYDASRDGLDLVEGEFLPSVNLVSNLSRGLSGSSIHDQSTTREILVSVSVPLYTGGLTFSRFRAQKETISQQSLLVEDSRRSVIDATTRAYASLRSIRSQITWLERQVKATEQALANLQEESRFGLRTVIELLNAQQEVFAAQVNLVVARHDELIADYQLRQTQGLLTARVLALDVPYYDAAAHADEVEDKWWGFGGELPSK